MLKFTILHPAATHEHLGFIPDFLDPKVTLPAWVQINDNYQHGGGWVSSKKNWQLNMVSMAIRYPGDPPLLPYASAVLGDEMIYVYEGSWVVIVQKDNTWDIARID